jgi:undecaprenyl-diphosphatase
MTSAKPSGPIPVVVNSASGRDDHTADDLRALGPGITVDERDAEDLTAAIEEHQRAGTTVIGIAGGDGSIRCAAQLLAGTGIAILPVPGGTHNHFAKLAGIAEIARVGDAVAHGSIVGLDIGRADGHVFLNNLVLGWYPALVADRDELTSRFGRRVARLLSTLRNVPRAHRFTVSVEEQHYHAWMVFIGNGEHGMGPLSMAQRERPLQHRLDVRVAVARGRLPRARLIAAVLTGRAAKTDLLERFLTDEITLTLRHHAHMALDGEVLPCPPVMTVRVEPGALDVVTLDETGDEPAAADTVLSA